MKLRMVILLLLALLLSACNLTLAQDVTPPPGYIPPTPMPTLAQAPQQTPNVANGAAIYAEKCAPCHGETGMGDGPQGIKLQGVTVPAFALPEIARDKSPLQWYAIVTRGRIERFMPPFASLSEQERWDVVAYITTLHITDEEIQTGKKLFEANCKNCSTDFFKNQKKMVALTQVELARLVRLGNEEIPPFGANLTDDEVWAIAAYLRTLSFDMTPAKESASLQTQPTPAPVIATPLSSDAGTPSAEETPIGAEQAPAESEATVIAKEGFGEVVGFIENKTGAALPADLQVTLRGFDHDTQNSGTPQEVLSLSGSVAPDGSFAFKDVELSENRIFFAEVTYKGILLRSDFAIVEAGQTSLELPPLVLRKITEDSSALKMDEMHIFFDASNETQYQILVLFTFRNVGETIVAVDMADQQEIPFLKFPLGAQGIGYEAMQDSAPFLSMEGGFAIPPSEQPYGILAFSSIARQKETLITQPIVLPVASVRIFVPDGLKLKGNLLTQENSQNIQGVIYQSYVAENLNAGEALTFTISGSPKIATGEQGWLASNSNLLIGIGGLGIAFILIGVWMYLRDRHSLTEEESEEEFESPEDVMDAIIALDDQHRAKKIPEEAYHKRREELKEILKEMMEA
ncbi:MAG TPA: c-type cytochrome [Anaerolineales bacterium]|nr:c-type cytochrome [Anaerolineales bacterium]